jgi:hypothetical protein
MKLDEIAIGQTYELDVLATRRLVIVEHIDVHFTATFYTTLAEPLRTALVWVYEPARGEQYPTHPRHLRRARPHGKCTCLYVRNTRFRRMDHIRDIDCPVHQKDDGHDGA